MTKRCSGCMQSFEVKGGFTPSDAESEGIVLHMDPKSRTVLCSSCVLDNRIQRIFGDGISKWTILPDSWNVVKREEAAFSTINRNSLFERLKSFTVGVGVVVCFGVAAIGFLIFLIFIIRNAYVPDP